jgi:hypothetical protein
MTSDKHEALVRLLRLMAGPEKHRFRAEFGMAETASDDQVVESLGKLPKYEAVRAFLRAADATVNGGAKMCQMAA